ncbi:unnamed protein product [Calypogeia fissa]
MSLRESIGRSSSSSSSIVSGFDLSNVCGTESRHHSASSERQFWMRSVRGIEAVTSGHLSHHSQSVTKQWALRSTSSTFLSSGGHSVGTSCVETKGRRKVKLSWNGHLRSNSEQRRSTGSSRLKRVRVAGGGWALPSLDYANAYQLREQAVLTNEGQGPSCIFVGPLETAEKARLEALYQQARDSYYSGSPLIVDDMFDRIEVKLRWHGSKLVLKYPRCSLKRFSAYADAELDASQMLVLASIWSVLLASGLVAAAFPPACAICTACQKAIHGRMHSHEVTFFTETMTAMNGALAIGLGLVLGVPVAIAAARSLQGLWRGELVALKGCCPNCAEEVYAFVRADEPEQPQHKTECHVCEHPLAFRAKVERSAEHPGKLWAYGRVYLLTQSKDLAPSKNSTS